MYVKHVKHIKAYNFLNNGLICNQLALLELSYSPLFTQYIKFYSYVKHVEEYRKYYLYSCTVIECMANMLDRYVSLYSSGHKTLINNMMSNQSF